jgi:hypothetical protein
MKHSTTISSATSTQSVTTSGLLSSTLETPAHNHKLGGLVPGGLAAELTASQPESHVLSPFQQHHWHHCTAHPGLAAVTGQSPAPDCSEQRPVESPPARLR